MAPVNFHEIFREQLPGTHKILRPLIGGTRGLKFLTTTLQLVAVLIPLEMKGHTVADLKALTCHIKPRSWHGCGSTFSSATLL